MPQGHAAQLTQRFLDTLSQRGKAFASQYAAHPALSTPYQAEVEAFVHQRLAGNGDFHILQMRKITQYLPTWQMLLAEHDLLLVTELKFPGFNSSLQGARQCVGIVAWVFFLQQFEQGNQCQCWPRFEFRDNNVIPHAFQRILSGLEWFNSSSIGWSWT
ncbi:Uncharacterised protein [Serratia proteamaculans]|nr:Uncharacterised protein [Serratia proteamaculans]